MEKERILLMTIKRRGKKNKMMKKYGKKSIS